MTKIAILGGGRVSTSLAVGLAKAVHRLVIGVRDPDDVRSWNGPDATFATHEEAIAASAESLSCKVLVDVANATGRDEAGRPSGLLYPTDSLAERLQAALPRTRVFKTLNTMLAPVMSDPAKLAAPATVLLSGDDADAKASVRALLVDMGWAKASILDLGGIATARSPEAVMLTVPDIIRVSGFEPFAVSIAR